MQLRLASALAGGPPLHVSVASSLGRLVAAGAADDVIVTYHERLCTDDCELFKQVKTQFPDLLIVVVCDATDGRAVRRALDSGIDGLVFADELEAALGPTVAAALAGQIALPRNLRTFARKPSLSAKERQVLRLLVMGCSNSEISARLFLAESTVKSHLSSAYTKLGVRSRSEAVSLLLDPKQSLGTGIGVLPPGPASSDVPRGGV
jgi:DNA-binding NarL/FixJ family response regulator